MPLFATLSGNDLIGFEELRQFHYRMGSNYKFFNIADYVRTRFISIDKLKKSDGRLMDEISNDTGVSRRQLITSLKLYDIAYKQSSIASQFDGGSIYAREILTKNWTKTKSMGFCDMQMPELLGLQRLWIPLYQRHLGVVMFHLEDKPVGKPILTRLHHEDEEHYKLEVKPTYPSCTCHERLLF